MNAYIPPTTMRHNVGTCPACRAYLWADVDVAVKVGEPTLSADGKASVYATPVIVGMRVSHQCEREEDDR